MCFKYPGKDTRVAKILLNIREAFIRDGYQITMHSITVLQNNDIFIRHHLIWYSYPAEKESELPVWICMQMIHILCKTKYQIGSVIIKKCTMDSRGSSHLQFPLDILNMTSQQKHVNCSPAG